MAGAMAAGSAARALFAVGGACHYEFGVTARRTMRIAHVVAAAATMAGRRQFFWGPSRAGAALASKARPARGSLTGARADRSRYQPRFTGMFCALRQRARRIGSPQSGLLARAGPGLLRCGSRGAQHTHC